jgi:hypothetical protein
MKRSSKLPSQSSCCIRNGHSHILCPASGSTVTECPRVCFVLARAARTQVRTRRSALRCGPKLGRGCATSSVRTSATPTLGTWTAEVCEMNAGNSFLPGLLKHFNQRTYPGLTHMKPPIAQVLSKRLGCAPLPSLSIWLGRIGGTNRQPYRLSRSMSPPRR